MVKFLSSCLIIAALLQGASGCKPRPTALKLAKRPAPGLGGFKKCVDFKTGKVTCRPEPEKCIVKEEFWIDSSATVDGCETSTVQYYKCYDSTGAQTCVKDYEGCGDDKTRMLESPGMTEFFVSLTACSNSEDFEWFRCYGEGMEDGHCRPQSCDLDEYAMLDTPTNVATFASWGGCDVDTVNVWYRCYGNGMEDAYCRPRSCKSSEYAMLDTPTDAARFPSWGACDAEWVPDWYKCYELGNEDGLCRPKFCKSNEFPMQDGTEAINFDSHKKCNDKTVDSWELCEDGGKQNCRPTACLKAETKIGDHTSFADCIAALP